LNTWLLLVVVEVVETMAAVVVLEAFVPVLV
jgi:hypothetical protein